VEPLRFDAIASMASAVCNSKTLDLDNPRKLKAMLNGDESYSGLVDRIFFSPFGRMTEESFSHLTKRLSMKCPKTGSCIKRMVNVPPPRIFGPLALANRRQALYILQEMAKPCNAHLWNGQHGGDVHADSVESTPSLHVPALPFFAQFRNYRHGGFLCSTYPDYSPCYSSHFF